MQPGSSERWPMIIISNDLEDEGTTSRVVEDDDEEEEPEEDPSWGL